MKRAITVLAVLVLFFVTTSANFASPSSKFLTVKSSSSDRNAISQSSALNSSFSKSFSDKLTYVRVFKGGKWWIYVYDGTVLVDIYPE